MALPTAGHRAERQLHPVAVAISVGVAGGECGPLRGVLLLAQWYGIDAVVFGCNLFEQNVAIRGAEPIEDDRSLTPDRVRDAPGMRRDVVAHRARRAVGGKSPDVIQRLQGWSLATAANLGHEAVASWRRCGGAPHESDNSCHSKEDDDSADDRPNGSAPEAPILLGAQQDSFGR